MNFKTIRNYYPLNDTIVGSYWEDYAFRDDDPRFKTIEDLKLIDIFDLEPKDGYVPFVVYEDHWFNCVSFSYYHVCGYYTNDENGENYQLMTYSEAFGYEMIDPTVEDEDNIVISPKDTNNLNEYVAREYNQKAYREKRIFMDYESLYNFMKNLNKTE